MTHTHLLTAPALALLTLWSHAAGLAAVAPTPPTPAATSTVVASGANAAPAGPARLAVASTAEAHDMIMALEQMLASRGDDSIRAFIARAADASWPASAGGEDALVDTLRELRDEIGGIGDLGVRPDGEHGVHMSIRNAGQLTTLAIALSPESGRIADVTVAGREALPELPAITWDDLDDVLRAAEAEGFCGAVLAAHDGELVVDAGYGHADPERRFPITPDTLFAVGSTPIDFTHGAILFLHQEGVVDLADPITRWFDDVPADKRGITLEHLRTGQSGLLDFPGLPGVDANLDLSWVDRDEFLRRVWASELRFAPGEGEAHSHVAWGLLAAVIEVATGVEYHAYLRETFFEPAGMTRTGSYSFTHGFPLEEVAVGLGGNTWGDVNAPPWWGPTSWLVKGSGGMVSTPRDLLRWRLYLEGGERLDEQARHRFGIGRRFLGEGGNDRGFVTTLGTQGADIVIVCSNAHLEMDDDVTRLAMALATLGAGG